MIYVGTINDTLLLQIQCYLYAIRLLPKQLR